MSGVAPVLITAVTTSSILVLLVSGLTVIVGMMGVLNLAHGDMVLLGAVCMYLLTSWGVPFVFGLIVSFAALFLLGAILERVIIRHLYANPAMGLLATWAIGLVIRETVRYSFGGTARNLAAPLSGTIKIAGVAVSYWQILIVAVALAVLLAGAYVLERTAVGLKVRATLDNPKFAMSCGVDTSRLYSVTFGVGCGLAGLAGAMVLPLLTLVPELGVTFLMKSFLGILAGGVGSLSAPIGGATVVQFGDSFLGSWLSPVTADLLLFSLVVLIVRFRPQGLFGRASL